MGARVSKEIRKIILLKGGKMSFIGKSVYAIWGGRNLRFGTVIEERTENKWKFVKVNWKDDEAYEMDRDRVTELRNIEVDSKYDWHRADNVVVFEPSEMITTLKKLKLSRNSRWAIKARAQRTNGQSYETAIREME